MWRVACADGTGMDTIVTFDKTRSHDDVMPLPADEQGGNARRCHVPGNFQKIQLFQC